MKIDWKLKGSNLLRFGCGKDTIVHPETCSGMVLMGHNNNKSLADWITSDSTLETKGSLTEWLTAYYAATLVIAQNDTQDPLTHHAGIIYPSEGLHIIDDAGGLAVAPAGNDTFGGIKLGYTDTDSTRGVQLDSSGNAFVSVDNISTDSYLQDWNGTVLPKSPRVYVNGDDSLGNVNLNDYLANFINYYSQIGVPSWDRMYPVRADNYGRLYAYVNWTQPTLSIFQGMQPGYVPNAIQVLDKTNKFLNSTGSWSYVSYNSLQNRPQVLGGYNSGFLVSQPSSIDTKTYLNSYGSWSIPTDTTYNVATTDETDGEGLLKVNTSIQESSAPLADNSESQTVFPDYFIPVVYNESTPKCHGVSLKLIMDTILADSEIMDALRDALGIN